MKMAAAILLSLCLLCGCSAKNDQMDRPMDLRSKLLESNGCSFTTVITADYEDRIYTFTLDCTADSEGNLSFTVSDPQTLNGITGKFSEAGGALTFDDKVLAFPLLADGQLAPICTPWILLNTLRSGYISACGQEEENLRVYYDDSFENAVLHLEVLLNENDIPLYGEIFWRERRILSADIRNFVLL